MEMITYWWDWLHIIYKQTIYGISYLTTEELTNLSDVISFM